MVQVKYIQNTEYVTRLGYQIFKKYYRRAKKNYVWPCCIHGIAQFLARARKFPFLQDFHDQYADIRLVATRGHMGQSAEEANKSLLKRPNITNMNMQRKRDTILFLC